MQNFSKLGIPLYILAIGICFSLASLPLVSAQASVTNSNSIQSSICGLIGFISSVIGILAIFLFVLGAILYAVAHILPAAGNLKGSTQGWGMGMLVGGVIAIILYVLSSFIIYRIASFSANGPLPAITQVNCNTLPTALTGTPSASVKTSTVSTSSSGTKTTSTLSTSSATTSSSTSTGFPAVPTIAGPTFSASTAAPGGGTLYYSGSSCQAKSGNVLIPQGNFPSGTYSGWTVTGSGFGTTPTEINIANENGDYYKTPWSNFNSEYFATTFRQNSVSLPGNLTSSSFEVTEPYLNFQIVSGQSSKLYVEVLLNNSPFIISHYNTTNGQGSYPLGTFANASIYVAPLFCQNVTVRTVAEVIGNSTNQNKFIAVGGFYLSNSSTETPGILVNSTVV